MITLLRYKFTEESCHKNSFIVCLNLQKFKFFETNLWSLGSLVSDDSSSGQKCTHTDGEIEFLGDEKSEGGRNKYFRCLKCGSVIIVSADGVFYEVPKKRT
jgi:hypothetical protein